MDIDSQIMKVKEQLKDLVLRDWLSQDVFSLRWWFLLVVLVLGYIVWIKLLDKRRVVEIVMFGALVAVINVFIDIVAVLYGLWTFKVRFLPIVPSVFPFDLSFIPVIYMLAYQYFTPWKKYLWGGALAAAVFVFIFFPILTKWDIIEQQNWNIYYSFILRYIEAIVARAAIGWMYSIQNRSRENKSSV
jgi:hypothetical protein